MGARMSEIKVNSYVDNKWYSLTGDHNPADLGTRTVVKPQGLVAGSDYQEGIGWTRRPEAELPCKRSFGQSSAEEMQKDMVAAACHTFAVVKQEPTGGE
jgi:hypothetical protein